MGWNNNGVYVMREWRDIGDKESHVVIVFVSVEDEMEDSYGIKIIN